MKSKYKVIRLYSIKEDGVNDACYTGQDIELPDNYTFKDVCRALKKLGYMSSWVSSRTHGFDPNNESLTYVMHKKTQMLQWELEKK